MKFKALPELIASHLTAFTKHAVIAFVLIVAMLYSFVLYRISVLDSATPSNKAVAAETQARPHIKQDVIDQLRQLNDNSVAAHSLFNKGRDNPFNE